MKLRCQEGDLAIVIREEAGCEMNVGRVVTVHGPVWDTEERGPTWLIVPVQADTWAVSSYRGGAVWHARITLEHKIEHPDDWLLPLRPEQETDDARGKAEKTEPALLSTSETRGLGTVASRDADFLKAWLDGLRLHEHPRIAGLHQQIDALPVGLEYRQHLLRALYRYAHQIVARPVYKPDEGLDDLEALQQATLSDMHEQLLRGQFQNFNNERRENHE